MKKFFLRWAINAIALYAAVALLPGVTPVAAGSNWWVSIIWLALIFGLVNALVRPLINLLTCPLILLTLGVFVLVVNALMFALTGWLGNQFSVGFYLSDPWWWNAFLGSLVVSVVSVALSLLLKDELEGRRHKPKAKKKN